MPLVQISDAIVPEVYADYQAENSPDKTAFVQSGIVVLNPMLDEKANTGGNEIQVPYWKDIDGSDEANTSDDSENDGSTSKITAGKQVARISYLNKGWKASDLASEMFGSNSMQRIRNRTGSYWTMQWQNRLTSSCIGMWLANVASGGDMVHDISIADGDNATASNLYSNSAFVSTAFTMGDRYDNLAAIAVHSTVYETMVQNEDIDYIKDSAGNLTIPTYYGKVVIVDDGLPVIAGGTSGFRYVSVLFGAGAFGYGQGKPNMPVEVERKASEGNGGGNEILWERKTWILHPSGYKFTSNSIAGNSPVQSELEMANNWERQVERKNASVCFLITNG